ncbi:MAG: tetratricopeptide repeat protein [Chlorobiaceae bacterium]
MIKLPALLLIITLVSSIQELLRDYRLQQQANTFYEKREYSRAESTLRQLLNNIPDGEQATSTTFNLGCTLYMQSKYAESASIFARKSKTANGRYETEINSLFNEGSSLAMNAIGTTEKSRKILLFRHSLDRLKSVLLNNPNDGDAKINYEIVRRYLSELDTPHRSSSSSSENKKNAQPKSGISQDMAQRLLQKAQQDESSLMREIPRNSSRATKSGSNNRDW